jgi:hypothetical protein
MKFLNLSLLALICALAFTSCQKEVDGDLGPQTGGSGDSSKIDSSKMSYYSTTVGSWWKFKDTASGIITTNRLVNRTKTMNGILYTALTADGFPDTAWVAAPRPDYYMYAKGQGLNTGASFEILFHFLNDTASVGYTWQYTAGSGNGLTALIQTTIMERNITMTVAGKTYNNVMHTQLVWTYDMFGTLIDAMSYDYFIAKGVGIIKVRSHGLTLLSGFEACTDLIDYSIK